MSHFGISQIHVDDRTGEIEEVKIHRFLRDDGQTGIGLDEGEAVPYHDAASRIVAGDLVWVIVPNGPGEYRHTDRVRIRAAAAPEERLESYDEGGAVTQSIYNLPKY